MNQNTTTKVKSKTDTKQLALIGLMAAITCILGPLSIPINLVPISFTNLAIYFSIYVLGMKKGTVSYLIYLLIGLVGIPVFSSFTGGPAKLFGPTGGYLIGFIFMALICGFFIDKWPSNLPLHFVGMVLGTAVCYLFGTVWLAYQASLSFSAALALGVIPFLPGDLCKIIISMIAGTQIHKALTKAGLYTR